MSWVKIILALVVILLYIPLVFMGANVFFPEYTGSESYYNYYPSCSYAAEDKLSCVQNDTCVKEQNDAQKAFDEGKNDYNANKYIFIVIFNLIVLLLAFFLTMNESVIVGLFLGSTLTSFISTWIYFSTQSKIGFGVLVIIFFFTIFFISKKRNLFLLKEKN